MSGKQLKITGEDNLLVKDLKSTFLFLLSTFQKALADAHYISNSQQMQIFYIVENYYIILKVISTYSHDKLLLIT